MQIKNHSFIAVCAFIGSLFVSTPLPAQDISPETADKLKSIGDAMINATLAGNLLSLVDYYTEDVILKPDFQPVISGKKALLALYKQELKKGVKYHAFSGKVEKQWQCGDEIFERGTFGLAVSAKESPKPVAYYGSYFQIWQQAPDGSFLISYVIWNLDFNPYEAH
jgi:ketosteroid isomerase-like protein